MILFHILYISYSTQLKRRNYILTEEEKLKVEMLLMDAEAKSQQCKIYVEAGDKTLKSLYSDLESYQSANRWNAFGWGAAGAGLGALGK